MQGIQIIGMGKALPAEKVTNKDLEQLVDTSDEWIRSRTGIQSRYFCREEKQMDLCAAAAENAMRNAGIRPEQIGLCIVATITADHHTPSSACMVQERLGLPEDIPAFDINAACSGFIYGLQVVSSMLGSGCLARPYALLIGAEKLSGILNMQDRSTCVLFADGAAAAVIRASESCRFFCRLGSKGNAPALYAPVHYLPSQFGDAAADPEPYIHMNGREVFQFAVKAMENGIRLLEEETGVPAEEIDEFVCHQANERIICHVQKKLRLPEERFYMNMDRCGNTSGASVPLVMAELMEAGRLGPGKKAFCLGFGGGLTWGAAYLEF